MALSKNIKKAAFWSNVMKVGAVFVFLITIVHPALSLRTNPDEAFA